MQEILRETEQIETYGALATRLARTLADARRTLATHANLLPRGRLEDFDELLRSFERRRVRIAIYGEVKAGKSTLLNAIAGKPLSPVAFEPLTSVPVRITYGTRPAWRYGDLTFTTIEELAEAMRGVMPLAEEVVVETDLDLLHLAGQVDLVDTPGVGSEERYDLISKRTLESLDAAILVVRYPALFTQFSRRLMESMEADIGKLFVVWNIDAACAEISADERQRHAETLRRKVAGAHDLFLVDARGACHAASAGDAAAAAATGLPQLVDALAVFAASAKRDVAAIREAGKRAHRWLQEAQEHIERRREDLSQMVSEARARLRAIETASEARTNAVREGFSRFHAAFERIAADHSHAAEELARKLTRAVRAAARRWAWTGDLAALQSAVISAVQQHADDAAAAARATSDAVREATAQFGTAATFGPRTPGELVVGELAPDERLQRSASGSLKPVRRLLFQRWYLPGLDQLERRIAQDLEAQRSWFEGGARVVQAAARATLEARLADIRKATKAEIDQVRSETHLGAREAEHDALRRHLPLVRSLRTTVEEINAEAWYLT